MANAQKVTIHIHNAQIVDGHEEIMDMTVVGMAYQKENRVELHYSEYDEDMHKTNTVVCAEKNRFVSVTRRGQYRSQMLFECGKRNTTAYSTPYGDLMMGMYTKTIQNTIPLEGDMNGKLSFSYTTDFAGQGGIENKMTLEVSTNKS